jgi:hypothetical protein
MSKKKNEGFAWISYETESDQPYITVDSQQRLYLSSGVCKLIGAECPLRLYVGYDHANMRLVVAKPDVVKATDTRPFKFDKRRYGNAKPFIKTLGLDVSKLPMRFTYTGKDFSDAGLPAGSFAFQLEGFTGADD